MPKNMVILRPYSVLVVGTVEYYDMTVEYKVLEKQLTARGYDPTSWLVYDEDCGSPTRGTRLEMLCIRRGFPDSRTPLHLCLVAAEHLLPWSNSIAVIEYKVPAHVFIEKSIRVGHNLLLPNYVGHIGTNAMHGTDGPPRVYG
jgi:hypothetical protein